MSTSLLTSKLYIPTLRPRSRVVLRPRLIERLNTGLGGRLTLVSAPAGFGKTTLLSEWIHAGGATPASPLQVAWVSLDEGDNDPARFWTYVLAALNALQPSLADDALALLRAPQPPPIEAVLTALINGVASLPQSNHRDRPYVLVLDDYHVVESPAIHEALAFLLDHMPARLHLLLSGRADPPLPLSRLRARGELAELRADDLRFTPAEAAAFLNQVMGLNLSAADIAVLETRTEGWIAGLQLAALSMRGRDAKRTASFIQAFSGSHRYILDYLVEEVLRRQPEAIQSFLLQTSILDRLSGSLCDAILGDQRPALPSSFVQGPSSSSAQAILEYLEAANLFIVPLDDERGWYRYHRLFGDLLRANLLQTHPGQVPELHRRAAAWYERHGFLAEAVGHRLAAGDVETAADLIEQSAGEMLWVRGEVATVLRWLAMLPELLVRSRPRLCLAYAWALFLSIHFEAVEARMQDAERALHEASLPDDSPERQDMVGQLAVMRAMLANFQGDIPRTLSLSRQALALVPESNLLLRAALAGNLGGAYAGIGNLVAAADAFAEAARLYRATGSAFGTLLASSYAGNMQLALGQLRQAAETYRQTLRLAAEFGGRASLGTRIAHVGLGRLSVEWNDLEDAMRHLVPAIEEAERQGDENVGPGPQLLLDGYLALARVHQAEGDSDHALEMMSKANVFAAMHAASYPGQAKAAQARLWLALDNLAAAVQWAEESGLGVDDALDHVREYEHLTLAQVLIAQERPGEALGLLKRLQSAAEAGNRKGSIVHSLALQALALQAQGQVEEALRALDQALRLAGVAEPEGYVRLFADEGAPMAELLRQAASRGIAPEHVTKLLTVFATLAGEGERAAPLPSSLLPRPAQDSLVEPLTAREIEVLRLIAEGASNGEIAAQLVIAVTTVKKHVSNIFGKLGVNSRTQAVARARDLNLLPSR